MDTQNPVDKVMPVLPNVETLMKNNVEYIQVKKDNIASLIEVVEMQSDIIQDLGATIEKMLEIMRVGSGMIDPSIKDAKQKWNNVVVAFDRHYDEILSELMRRANQIGVQFNIEQLYPEFSPEEGNDNESTENTMDDK